MFEKGSISLRSIIKDINWQLLVFLLLFLNVKLVIKIAAMVIIYLLQPNFKFRLKEKLTPIHFYLSLIVISLVNWLIFKYYLNFNYNLSLLTGIGFWLLCLLAFHQLKLMVEGTDTVKLHNTLTVFFVLNSCVSLITVLVIILKTQHVNPYTYQGDFQKYFLNTGDYIKGVTFDVSVTNAAISAFGVVYFLLQNKAKLMLLCMATLLLTVSNTVNILLMVTIVLVFIFKSIKVQKSLMVACLMLLIIFMAKVTPQNMFYIDKLYNKVVFNKNVSFDPVPVKERRITDIPDSELNKEQRQEKIAQFYLDTLALKLQRKEPAVVKVKPARVFVLPIDSIHTATFQSRADTDFLQAKLLAFIHTHKNQLPISSFVTTGKLVPGKLMAARQTINYFRNHPVKAITGEGIGNFSSKLAFRTTALGVAGGYPAKYAFIGKDFLSNHLDVYLRFFSEKAGMHSLIHSPDNTYDQLLSEYGLLGTAAFLVIYIGFFIKRYKQLSYGLPLLLLMLGLFFIGYWFEQLSIVVLFELLMFIDLKGHDQKGAVV
ncbi:hypothetical protein [Mucilaginibacter sp. KACC 22063]|uniref:hypothetical protein n=1 Tax=Mucilaginibacter sp. KACC 22063 TaxID=3025666 RepID=UPI00236689B3|nr:hypothetical protein [Mucilaginibacter sp. KACC 22063]WDF53815.1 hypothetical protein PQ461_12750 [Mucilaginibacter sp. KACC 22063]